MRLLLILPVLYLAACDSGGTGGDDPDPSPRIEKSEKRGIAYDIRNAQDLEALRDGVSWWYNWTHRVGTSASREDYQMEYLPMLWGHDSSAEFAETKQFFLDHPDVEYLLVLNEPNLTDQANMTPQRAAVEWVKYEQLQADLAAEGRAIKLVGPQITWGTMPNYGDPLVWMDAFYEAYGELSGGGQPVIDYLAFHWYDYGLEEQLNRLRKYGKDIWITEMANWNAQIDTEAKQIQQMTQMVALAESRSDVFRYAWFIGRWDPDPHHTSLFEAAPGQLSGLGQVYVNLPY